SLSHVLVVSQIALSLLILVAAGLFLRTLSNLQSVELGFNQQHLLLFEVNARQAGQDDGQIGAFYADLQKRFAVIPGVLSVSLAQDSLIRAGRGSPVNVPGKDSDPNTRLLFVGPAYFTTMQIPLLEGREVEERDRSGSQEVAVISEHFAKLNFGDQN